MRRLALILVLPSIFLAGCGDDLVPIQTAPVSGKATYNGKPLTGYTVYFFVPGGAAEVPAVGDVGPDGAFTLGVRDEGSGAIVGLNQVWVKFTPEVPDNSAKGPVNTVPPPKPKVKIPKKYTSRATSGLTVEVPPEGLQSYELTLDEPTGES